MLTHAVTNTGRFLRISACVTTSALYEISLATYGARSILHGKTEKIRKTEADSDSARGENHTCSQLQTKSIARVRGNVIHYQMLKQNIKLCFVCRSKISMGWYVYFCKYTSFLAGGSSSHNTTAIFESAWSLSKIIRFPVVDRTVAERSTLNRPIKNLNQSRPVPVRCVKKPT